MGTALLVAASLGTASLLVPIALVVARRERAVRDRVRALAGQRAVPTASAPTIRLVETSRGAGRSRLFRLIRFDPDMPEARRVPRPLVAGLAVAVGLLGAWRLADPLGTVLAALAAPLLALLVARAVFGWEAGRYRDAVFRQIPDALGTMVRAIRAGLPLAEALRGIAREGPQPIRGEFARVVGDLAIGRPVDVALMRLHERTGLTEFSFLAVTLGLQARTGGALAETLDTLADMVRRRVAMARRAEALAAEGRMQAGLLSVLPFVAALAMSVLQPFYLDTFIGTEAGRRLALIGFALMTLGIIVIRRMIRAAGRD